MTKMLLKHQLNEMYISDVYALTKHLNYCKYDLLCVTFKKSHHGHFRALQSRRDESKSRLFSTVPLD